MAAGKADEKRARRRRAPQPRFTVFLDRDGVFDRDPVIQVRRPEGFEWLQGAIEAFARLNRPDVQTCLITNQPGTGFGVTTPGMVHRLHAYMQGELEEAGGRLDRIEVCFVPFPLPSRRRKPRPGMFEDAAAAFAAAGHPVAKDRAIMVGDKIKDAQAAAAFGIPCILLATSSDRDALAQRAELAGAPFLAIVDGLADAVDLILTWL